MVVGMKSVQRLILTLVYLLLAAAVFAQNVNARAFVDKTTVGMYDKLHYTISVTSDRPVEINEPILPTIDGLTQRNMMSSTSRSTSIVNTQVTHQIKYDYTYVLLPTRPGSSIIPAVSVSVGNRTYRTEQIPIQILASAHGMPQSPSLVDPFDYWTFEENQPATGLAFIAAETPRHRIWLNEPAVISYYLYTNQDIMSLNLREEKDFPGYGKAEFDQPQSLTYHYVDHNGQTIRRALLKRLAISPNVTGTIRVPQLVCSARLSSLSFSSLDLASRDLSLEVLPLPALNRPANFSGAVGSFRISENMNETQLILGEVLNYSIQISGRGNFNQFSAPQMASTPHFRIAVPVISGNLKAGIDGLRSYFYTAIPQDKGDFVFSGATFNWFDTDSGIYRIWRGEDHQINVKPGNVFSTFTNFLQREDAIRFNSAVEGDVSKPYHFILGSIYYWLAVFLLGISLLASYLVASTRNLRLRDPEHYAGIRAERHLRRYLREAQNAARQGHAQFYPLGEKGLIRYLAEKHNVPNHLSTEDRMDALVQRGIPEELITQVRSFLLRCQTVRYMPGGFDQNKLQDDLSSLKMLINALSGLQKTPRSSRSATASAGGGAFILCLILCLLTIAMTGEATEVNTTETPALTSEIARNDDTDHYELDRMLELENKGIRNPDLYFNVGVQYSERQANPMAILYYLRALNLDSSHRPARENLEYTIATGSNRDQYPRHSFLAGLFFGVYNYLNLNRLSLLCLILFALIVLCSHWLMHLNPEKERGLPILTLFILLFFLLGFVAMLGFKYYRHANNAKIVITSPSVNGHSSPDAQGDILFSITAGLIAEVKQHNGDWALIVLPNGGSGWIHRQDFLAVKGHR